MTDRHQLIERLFGQLVERIPGIVSYLDLFDRDDPSSSVPIYISPQIEELLGYPRDAWLTEDELWLDVLHPDDRERQVAADAEARRTGSPLFGEYRMVARDGRVVWVSEKSAVVEDEVTGTTYWQGLMVDITERREAEEALATSEGRFRSIFDAASIGVMTLDLDGCVVEANVTLESVCGYPTGALHDRRLGDLVPADDESVLQEFAALAAGRSERCELEHRFSRHDDSLMWCRTVFVLVRDGVGRPVQVTAMLEDISDRKETEESLVHRASHDALTGLPNRQLFLQLLADAARNEVVAGSGLAVLFIDMDGFKETNDSLGHHAGDELLVAVAGRLRAAVRPTDDVARYGGDEFLVLATDVVSVDDATQLAWRLVNTLRAPFAVAGQTIRVTASFGIAYDEQPEEHEELVRKADAAMYLAKQRGRNRVAVFGEVTPAAGAVAPGAA